ncbi:MAG: CARDB domain-containing protein [Eubacteriales bacterium]|nr:CARDB domain-containing protein [Eubacteriales bacterium]
MKKFQLLTSILLVLLMVIAPQSIAFAADDSPQASAVSLVSDGFSVDKKSIYAGDTFKLTYKIKNTNSKLDVKNLNMRLSGGDTFTVANDVDTIYSSSLSKGASAQFSKNFYVSAGASAGMYPITVSASYDYTEDGETMSATAEFSYTVQVLPGATQSVGNSPSLVASFGINKGNLTAGDNFKLNFKLSNKSAQYNVNNVNIKLAGGDAFSIASDVDTIYKSKINKASSANFSKQFICNKNASGGMYPITASVTYEYTANGEKQQGTAEFTFSIKVNSKKGSKKATALTPQLIVSSFNYGKTSISGGKQFTLSFNIKNNSPSIKAQNVLIKLAGGDSFVVADGTDTISIKSIKPNGTVNVSKKFSCLSTATSGVYPITATVSYEYIEGGKQSGSNDLTMSIPVVQPDKVQFQQIALADKTINVSEENDCTFQIINMGQTKLSNGTVKLLNEKGKELNSAYVGNIEAGGQFASNYTLPVTFNKTGDYKLTLVFEYENENMDKKSIEQEFKVTVQKAEDPFDDVDDNSADNGEAQDDHSNVKKIILGSVIGGVVLITAIVSIVVIKKKKHKKGSVKFDEEI